METALLAQAEDRQDEEHDDDEADEIDDAVHETSFWATADRTFTARESSAVAAGDAEDESGSQAINPRANAARA
jgi:hypothetical protein